MTDNVTATFMTDKAQNELNSANFVIMPVDVFNILHFKLVPLLTRIFVPQFGVKVQLIWSDDFIGETADTSIKRVTKML